MAEEATASPEKFSIVLSLGSNAEGDHVGIEASAPNESVVMFGELGGPRAWLLTHVKVGDALRLRYGIGSATFTKDEAARLACSILGALSGVDRAQLDRVFADHAKARAGKVDPFVLAGAICGLVAGSLGD